jgi:peptidoglycan/xylan/chitin deacetylase (PgdA/CDA1 family)
MVEIGAHTVDHTLLAALDPTQQREQILSDKRALEQICGREMETFSYPYGSLSDYTDATVEIVREAGFRGACSNHLGVVKPWTDPYRLPRRIVRDYGAEVFSANLEEWFANRG